MAAPGDVSFPAPLLLPVSEFMRRFACPCRHAIEEHESVAGPPLWDGGPLRGKCNSPGCTCQSYPQESERNPTKEPPRRLTGERDRHMARSVRLYQWRFMESVLWHGVLWFTPWEQNRERRTLADEWRTGLLTGNDIVRWWHQHPDWFLIGQWDDDRSARPVALTEAGYQALCHRSLYDMEPVEGGMVEPGWSAVPLEATASRPT